MTLYAVHVNFSSVNMDEVGNAGGTADWVNILLNDHVSTVEYSQNYLIL